MTCELCHQECDSRIGITIRGPMVCKSCFKLHGKKSWSELLQAYASSYELGRTQGLEEAAKYCELQSHECWKNVAHEEFMNRIENAAQYDILVGEFKHLAIRIRKLAAIRPVEQ